MPKFYTVDRIGSIEKKETIDLIKYIPSVKDRRLHIDFLFSNGISKHGMRYLDDENYKIPGVERSHILEIIFEYIRRGHFPKLPSRYQSFFAFEKIEECVWFRNDKKSPSAPIYEVECDTYFRADMNCLYLLKNMCDLSIKAHRYWSGQPASDIPPVWEILLTPPVKIVKLIELN
ncbi:MAG: hypothetical protein A2X59_04470 [Nitrospirae bacterium GWC2_42_7]|nr:MAG: hypothetical protein A2X59_04470 [Nitrospirae bacterium GWC2_42_7]